MTAKAPTLTGDDKSESNENFGDVQNNEIESFTFSYVSMVGLYFVMTWVGLFPSVLVGYFYFTIFPFSFDLLYLLMLIPLFLALYGIALLSSLLSTKFGIWLVHKLITYPQLGTYRLSMEEPQTRAFVLKGNLKNFGRWLFYTFNFQFLRAIWLRQMGVKLGKNVKLGVIVQDEEFIEIGDNTFMAWNSGITAHLMDQEYLTLSKTIVGKNCIFEDITGTMGAKIGDNSVFNHGSGAMKGHLCRGNAIYSGLPPKKVGTYSDLSPEEIEDLKQKIRKIDKTNFIREKNAPIKINETKFFLMKVLVVIGGLLLGIIFPYLYSLIWQTFYVPLNHLQNILLLTLVPLIFLCTLALFVVGTSVVIKIFLVYYDRKATIPEGTYELNDPLAKYFKIKYCLRMFGLRLFHLMPFRIVDTYALRFWGNIKLGKNTKLDDATVDPQYLELGDYSQIAAGARVHTHDIIKGKLYVKKVIIGKDVLVGTFSHIKPGVEIADGSICAIMAWFRKNRKCKRRALWLGKPAAELPIEIVSRSARAKERYVD